MAAYDYDRNRQITYQGVHCMMAVISIMMLAGEQVRFRVFVYLFVCLVFLDERVSECVFQAALVLEPRSSSPNPTYHIRP